MKPPQEYRLLEENSLTKIQEWNSKAFLLVKEEKLPLFKNCIFSTQGLQEICGSLANAVLTFSLVYLEADTEKQSTLLSYPLVQKNLPNITKKFLLAEIVNHPGLKYEDPLQEWKNKHFKIAKKLDNQIYHSPAGEFAPDRSINSFVDWLQGFKSAAAIRAYPDTLENAPQEPMDKLNVYFDIALIKADLDLLNPDKYPYIALIPIVFYVDGPVSTGGSAGNYITYCLTPLNSALEMQLLTSGQFLASGCTYPRPWDHPVGRECTDLNQLVQISDIQPIEEQTSTV